MATGAIEVTAYKLAVIQEGFAQRTDPIVADYAKQLARLLGQCVEGPEQLGNMAVVAQRLLQRHNVSESLLAILTHVANIVGADPGSGTIKCSQAFADEVIYLTS